MDHSHRASLERLSRVVGRLREIHEIVARLCGRGLLLAEWPGVQVELKELADELRSIGESRDQR